MTNIMNLLSLLSGQQDPTRFGRKYQAGQDSYPIPVGAEQAGFQFEVDPRLRPTRLQQEQAMRDAMGVKTTTDESGVPYLYPDPKSPPTPSTPWYEHAGKAAADIGAVLPALLRSGATGEPLVGEGGTVSRTSEAIREIGSEGAGAIGKAYLWANPFTQLPMAINKWGRPVAQDLFALLDPKYKPEEEKAEPEKWVPTGEKKKLLAGTEERFQLFDEGKPAPDKPDKEVKPTPEVEEGNKQDSTTNTDDPDIKAQSNAINDWASGLDYDQRSISQQIADSLNVRMEDVSEQISQLRNQLKTELDRHVGWPELLIAFGMGLMGHDGVGYIRALEAHNRGRVATVQTALDRARGLEGGLQDRWLNFLLTGQKAEQVAGEKNISALEDHLKREIGDISAKETGFQRTLGAFSDLGPASFKSTGGQELYGAIPGKGEIESGRRSKKMFSDMIKLLNQNPSRYAGLSRTNALKALREDYKTIQKQKADK